MLRNKEQFRLTANGPRVGASASGFLGKILTTVASVVVLVAAFMLSLVIFTAVAVTALIAGAYLWWKTRELRRQMREQSRGGRIIDGEVILDSATTGPDQDPTLR